MTWNIKNVKISNRIVFAPMAGVSNISYRQIIKEMGAGLIYSEMISTLGIKYNGKKTIDLINFEETERPISIQIFGSDITSFVSAAKYIEENFHPDIIDINMGCPVLKVSVKAQAGSALLKSPEKVFEIVKAVVESVPIPVTVKIRSGWDEKSINAVEIAKICEKAGASAITVHPRTRAQGYSGQANWDIIRQVKENVTIPVIGNGDIKSCYDAKRMLEQTNCDMVMIGRAVLGNPWLIKETVDYLEYNIKPSKITYLDRLNMISKHIDYLLENNSERITLLQMRSHVLWYLKGINSNLKKQIMEVKTVLEFKELLDEEKKIFSLND